MAKVARAVQVNREPREELTEDEVTVLKDVAHENRISIAKLTLINKIIDADSSYTLELLKVKSIKELYRILGEVLPEADDAPGNNDNPGNN